MNVRPQRAWESGFRARRYRTMLLLCVIVEADLVTTSVDARSRKRWQRCLTRAEWARSWHVLLRELVDFVY